MTVQSVITRKQKLIFCILWFAYGGTYLLRKPFGFLKDQIKAEYNIPQSSLGYIDLSFLLPYTVVALILGGLVDKIGTHITLCGGLLVSALATLLMFFVQEFVSLLMLLIISGSFQALCWPSCFTLLNDWFPNAKKATLFGWFGTTCFLWSLLGSLLPVVLEVINKDYHMWKSVFIVASLTVIAISIPVALFIRPANNTEYVNSIRTKNTFSTLRAFTFPIVKEVSFAVFFIKSVRYTFIFWLPYYMVENLSYTAIAGGISAAFFDVGGVLGSLTSGYIIERCFKGNDVKVCIYNIFGSVITLVLFFVIKIDGTIGWIFDILWLTLAGSFISASDIILTGSIASKLGELHGASSAIASVLNGMGSLGTIIEGPLIAYCSFYFGLSSIIPLLIFLSSLALYFIIKTHKLMMQEKNLLSLANFS